VVTESATDPSVAFGDSSPQGRERLSAEVVPDLQIQVSNLEPLPPCQSRTNRLNPAPTAGT
jgi:hypothetical protein